MTISEIISNWGGDISKIYSISNKIRSLGYTFALFSYKAYGHAVGDTLIHEYLYINSVYKRKAIFIIDKEKCPAYEVLKTIEFKSCIFIDDKYLSKALQLICINNKNIVRETSGIYYQYRKRINCARWIYEEHYIKREVKPIIPKDKKDLFNQFMREYNLEASDYVCLHLRASG